MREQVVVLPPSSDKKKASFNLGKKDEPLLIHPSKDSRKWVAAENENAEKFRGFVLTSNSKDLNHTIGIESFAAEKMKREVVRDGEDDSIEALKQEVEGERHLSCSTPLLQWGQRKRSRCSRADNHNPKPCDSPDDSTVLCRKTVRVQADKSAANTTHPLASKGILKFKNGAVAKKEHLFTTRVAVRAQAQQLEKGKQAKPVKNGLSDVRQERKGSPLAGNKRACPASTHTQEHRKKVVCDLKSASPNTCVLPIGGGSEASPSKVEFVWPKFMIGLSRKEKEEDFLILKGTKLPQRPRRRPKAVERILHYYSPGSWLADVSQSRYDIREKKRGKKKPRGLKAMESFDSDSE
ncbi:hypothetical protein GOP47_0026919 [Adiantum capillus-veneris]|nr:hypothetical protein GOP47_0026351 [Adiantum capillus-veneris]KAI5058749.1 hypothetical protein GOP47_0026919 [Adiantum capillus-veneris]